MAVDIFIFYVLRLSQTHTHIALIRISFAVSPQNIGLSLYEKKQNMFSIKRLLLAYQSCNNNNKAVNLRDLEHSAKIVLHTYM